MACLQADNSCLLVGSAEGELVRFAQQPGSSIWVEDKQVSVGGTVTSLASLDTGGQAVVGTSLGTIW